MAESGGPIALTTQACMADSYVPDEHRGRVEARVEPKVSTSFLQLLTQGELLFGQLRQAYEAEVAALARGAAESSAAATAPATPVADPRAGACPAAMARMAEAPVPMAGSNLHYSSKDEGMPASNGLETNSAIGMERDTPGHDCYNQLMALGLRECYLMSPSDHVRERSNGGSKVILDSQDEEEDVQDETQTRKCVFFPNSVIRMYWDILGGVFLLWDMIMIPMGVFQTFDTGLPYYVDSITMVFWSCDMGMAFFTGFVTDGRIVLAYREIAVNYFRTWFTLDCIVVIPDWVFLFSGASEGSGNGFGIMRALRILRVARLLRVAKLKRVLLQLQDRINSEYMAVVMTILKLFIFMIATNHVVGCIWYWVGYRGMVSGDPNWIQAFDFEHATVGYRYVSALHWSITQFTPGSMHVQPMNLAERILTVVVLLSGMVVFSSFVSSITGAMTALRGLQEDSWKQTWMLRRYLRERGVGSSSPLYLRIQRYAAWSAARKKGFLQESKVQLLADLSQQLKNELRVEILLAPLKAHPLIFKVAEMSRRIMLRLAKDAVTKETTARDDISFYEGESAKNMLVVQAGRLTYCCSNTLSVSKTTDNKTVSEGHAVIPVDHGSWICEMVLWTEWVHRGQLRALEECELIKVEADQFSQVVRQEPSVLEFIREHAMWFMAWLQDNKTGVSDLDSPCLGAGADPNWKKTVLSSKGPPSFIKTNSDKVNSEPSS
eukprot:TRINITY_DN13083_c0_g8_i1.p1 TRINITY_DN13083_c0_g8~~TRINITY_DN13083_c0_g8_i1.p1  ORF type:complete len:720 (+),score=148.81 TRINITY_DN13083_c0_g8_i1:273-2432(+)